MENLVNSFHKFVSNAKIVFVNGDDPLALKACADINARIITFGENQQNDYYFDDIKMGKLGYGFSVFQNLGVRKPIHPDSLLAAVQYLLCRLQDQRPV